MFQHALSALSWVSVNLIAEKKTETNATALTPTASNYALWTLDFAKG